MVQNQSLKSEIQKLEQEKMRLMQVLSGHDNACLQRMQQEAIEIKQEGLPSPIDENEFRVPSTVPIVPSISQGSITTGASFTEPVSAYTENTAQNTQPLLSNNVLLVNETNVLPYTMSQGNPHLHNQSLMTSGHGLVGNLSPPECHPPSFDEAVRIATEIKMEESSQEPIVQNSNQLQQIPQGFPQLFESESLQQINESRNDFFRAPTFGNHSISDNSSYFLAKRPLGHTYLDLDSRCIALSHKILT